jgi:transposase
VEGGRGVV